MAMVNLKMQKVRPPLFFESLHDPPPPPSGLWTADAVQLHKTEQQSHPSSTLFQYPPSGLFVSEVYRMKPSFLAFVLAVLGSDANITASKAAAVAESNHFP
jgi:hypothetical protein